MPATLKASQTWTIDRDDAAGIVFIRSPHLKAVEPDNWRRQLAAALRRMPGVAIAGAKRLDGDGKLFSMGEYLVHPKGFHSLGKKLGAAVYRFPLEADAVAGGVLALRADVFDAVDGDSLCQGELGAIMLCLAVRRQGGRCVVLPSVVAQDSHSPEPSAEEDARFEAHFDFDWLAADMDAFEDGDPLLWNVRFQGVALPFEKYETRQGMHWRNYAETSVYKQRADHLVDILKKLATAGGPVLDLGCGDGLFTHLVALQGLEALGVDPETSAIQQARQLCAGHSYPGKPPRFELGSGDSLPHGEGTFRIVYMFDVIEHLPNPMRVLREAARVLHPDGRLLITTPAWQYETWSDPVYHVTEYTPEELVRQIAAATRHERPLLTSELGKIEGVYRDLVLIAKHASGV